MDGAVLHTYKNFTMGKLEGDREKFSLGQVTFEISERHPENNALRAVDYVNLKQGSESFSLKGHIINT